MKHLSKKFLQQDGQTAVFYALLLPVLILFLFIVFDLGWLYLNKSRLQNAAEAAAIAGANKFCEVTDKGFNNVVLIHEGLNANYKALRDNKKELDYIPTKESSAIYNAAKASLNKNLGVSADADKIEKDSWTNAEVKMAQQPKLYGESVDSETIYYEVQLTETVHHLFKVLDDIISTDVPAIAVAEITRVRLIEERNLWEDMSQLSGTQVIGNWEEQYGTYTKKVVAEKEDIDKIRYYSYAEKVNKSYYDGIWNHYQDPDIKVHYKTGDVYKTEHMIIASNSASAKSTAANGGKIYDMSLVDSLNIDFKQDVKLNFSGELTSDWDIGFSITGTDIKSANYADSFADNWNNSQLNLRVHATMDFNEAFLTRTLSEDAQNKVDTRYRRANLGESADADPLYIHIESEPMVSNLANKDQQMSQLNSVRQIIININESNMDEQLVVGDDEKTHKYTYRPLVFFYNGPEINDENSGRHSQPVIINLNANFRGIIFMPNSPVVINGNGYEFQGLVIAEEFRKLKTEADYTKFTRTSDNKSILIKNVEDDTEAGSADNWIMVKKPDTEDWVKISKDKLRYSSEYAKIAVNSDAKSVSNTGDGTAYSFTYTKTNYFVKRSKLAAAEIFYAADDFDTTTYYRLNTGRNETTPTPAYIRKNLIQGKFEGATLGADGKWVGGTLNPSNAEMIPGRREGEWYEFKKTEDDVWSINNNKSKKNFFQYKDGWRLITTEDEKQYIIKNTDITNLKNSGEFISTKDYVEVTDAEGNMAYIKKTDLKVTPVYSQIKRDNETRYCDKTNGNYYIKKDEDSSNSLILDTHGNVQYTEKLSADKTYSLPKDLKQWENGFSASTFNLATDVEKTHYSRCGAIPRRLKYGSLDAFEKGGDYCQDMFFETLRSKYVL